MDRETLAHRLYRERIAELLGMSPEELDESSIGGLWDNKTNPIDAAKEISTSSSIEGDGDQTGWVGRFLSRRGQNR